MTSSDATVSLRQSASSRTRFTQYVLYLPKKVSSFIWFWIYLESLQCFSSLKSLVVKQPPDQEDLQTRRLRAKIDRGIVSRQTLNISAGD